LLAEIEESRVRRSRATDAAKKSRLGQFLTPAATAGFMASLFGQPSSAGSCDLLDAGAGIGSLSLAFLEACLAGPLRFDRISVCAYEIDEGLAAELDANLDRYRHLLPMTYAVRREDFVKAAALDIARGRRQFTHAILNPPYRKLNTAAVESLILRQLGLESPNLYSAFVALALSLMVRHGQLVAIIPRSFCNGPYYSTFRSFILDSCAVRRIHLFASRSSTFKDDDVLQENVIIHLERGGEQGEVAVSTSTDSTFSDLVTNVHPFSAIVTPGDPQRFIHVPESTAPGTIETASSIQSSLADVGVEVSTGPVVDFRLRQHLRRLPEEGAVPLLYPGHFRDWRTDWPKGGVEKSSAIVVTADTEKWLYPVGYYCVVRRFSAKEERRRIVASVVEPDALGVTGLLGFENHLNVFHSRRQGLSRDLAWGLAAYLNTTAVDKHFRRFSGHTQVNATDLRQIKYPRREVLIEMGAWAVSKQGTITQEMVDSRFMEVATMPMDENVKSAAVVLAALGLPEAQQNERSALCLLALLNLTPERQWSEAGSPMMGITPIMDWIRTHYGKEYAPNTRETFRRQTMHQFVDAGVALYNPDEPERPVNSPKAVYQISPAALSLLRTYGTPQWTSLLAQFQAVRPTLAARYAMERDAASVSVTGTSGIALALSPGEHSALIRAVIERFVPQFVPTSTPLYVGDTGQKWAYCNRELLANLGVRVDSHGKMPDVILYDRAKQWLVLVEAVTSHGPVDAKRHAELAALFAGAMVGLVYVTAFPTKSVMARYVGQIAWETEVWTADSPTHMVHFNGDRFLGPYPAT